MEGLKVTVAIKGTKENKKLAGHIIIATPGKIRELDEKEVHQHQAPEIPHH